MRTSGAEESDGPLTRRTFHPCPGHAGAQRLELLVSACFARPCDGAADLDPLIAFAREATAARLPGLSYLHAGDMVWALVPYPELAAPENVRLWFAGDRLAAYALFEPPVTFQFDVRPDLDEDIAAEVLAWAESRWRELATGVDRDLPRAYEMLEGTLSTTALESDGSRQELLERSGYEWVERHSLRFRKSLDTVPWAAELPDGMRLRHVTEADVEERMDLHRDAWAVWGPSSATDEGYRRLREAPVYREDLDVVLEAADGRLVSYCICWADPATGTGVFEPVGTRPAFVGRGYGRTVIREGLRRLREAGLHTALVSTASVNEGAAALYRSCGFETVEREYYWAKRVSPPDASPGF